MRKKGCLDAYCSAAILSGAAEGKLGKFFELLEKKDQGAAEIWDVYTGYLAVALNNIHMLLDCDIILGDMWEVMSSLIYWIYGIKYQSGIHSQRIGNL